MKKIQFDYIDDSTKKEHEENVKKWGGCCCLCRHQKRVTKHCCHSPSSAGGCVCNEPLGFFVCTVFADMGDGKRANLCGKHGICECFTPRKSRNGRKSN